MNSTQEPNNSSSTHSQVEKKVIFGIFVMKGFNRHTKAEKRIVKVIGDLVLLRMDIIVWK